MTLKFRFYHVDDKIKSHGKQSLTLKTKELSINDELILMCDHHIFASAQAKVQHNIEFFSTDCESLLKEHKELEIEFLEDPEIFKSLHDNFAITLTPVERV